MISAADIASRLEAYLDEAKERPTVWGESDCTKWVQEWIETIHCRRMTVPTWASRTEAHALIVEAGTLDALWMQCLTDFGLEESWRDAVAGDVGIIRTHVAPQVGGIFLNHGLFAWRSEPKGFRVLLPKKSTIVRVWSLQ